jgi:hypothetical protein
MRLVFITAALYAIRAPVEAEYHDGMGRGARRRPDEPVPACRAWPVRGITGGTTEVVTATTPAPGRPSHTGDQKTELTCSRTLETPTRELRTNAEYLCPRRDLNPSYMGVIREELLLT